MLREARGRLYVCRETVQHGLLLLSARRRWAHSRRVKQNAFEVCGLVRRHLQLNTQAVFVFGGVLSQAAWRACFHFGVHFESSFIASHKAAQGARHVLKPVQQLSRHAEERVMRGVRRHDLSLMAPRSAKSSWNSQHMYQMLGGISRLPNVSRRL